jgi:hypothetical protein
MKVKVTWKSEWPDDIDEDFTGYSFREAMKMLRKRLKHFPEPDTVLIGNEYRPPKKVLEVWSELGKLLEFVHKNPAQVCARVQEHCRQISRIVDEVDNE